MTVTVNGNTYTSDDAGDTVTGSESNDFIYGNLGNDIIKAQGGNDYIDAGVGDDNVSGGDGNDTIYDWTSSPSTYVGLIGHDIIHGDGGDDNVSIRSPDTGDFAYGDDGTDTINIWLNATMATPAPIRFSLTEAGSMATLDGVNTVWVQGFEKLVFLGNIGDDFVEGGGLADDIELGAGNDTLRGLGGDDYLDGGTGQQFIDGGADTDTVAFDLSAATEAIKLDFKTRTFDLASYGTLANVELAGAIHTGSGNDVIVNSDAGGGEFDTGNGDDQFTGGNGIDTWNMGGGGDTGSLGAGNDRATAEGFESDTGSKNVHGGDGNDWLVGAAGSDQFYGENDNDYISGQGGNDQLDGGAGNDTIRGGAGGDQITGGAGNDALDGDYDDTTQTDMPGDDTVSGGAGDDSIGGGLGADRLNGDAGNDSIFLTYASETLDTGLDVVDGGTGTDSVVIQFENSQSWDYVITSGASTKISVNGTQMVTLRNTESILYNINANGTFHFTGGDEDDNFRLGSIATGNDTINTGGGNDTIDSAFGGDTIDSGDGDDNVTVEMGGKDNVKTGAGNDTLLLQSIFMQAIDNTAVGTFDMGSGNGDTLTINAWDHDINFTDGRSVTLDGKVIAKVTGWESLVFNADMNASTNYVGSNGNEQIFLQYLNDTATGGGGDDTIQGGGGNDILDGGAGSDTAMYENDFSSVVATLNGAKQVTVRVNGVAEDKIKNFENLTGGYGGDTLTGDKGDNTLNGWGGNDTLKGGNGDDIIIGSAGTDTMSGGSGKDHFVFNLVTSQTPFDTDVVSDFKHGEDKLDFSALDTNAATPKDDPFTFLKQEGAAFDGKHAEIRFDKQSDITVVEADLNGDGFADIHIQLTGAINLDKNDIIL
jgi:Ca2+-binding RTX toxin-like protein